mgnify:FL=1
MFEQVIGNPEPFLNEDFIGVWDNVTLDDFNNHIIDILDNSTQIIPRSNQNVKDSQLDLSLIHI